MKLRGYRRGFTLLEIILVLGVAAVLLGLSLPYISSMLRENELREPVRELQDLVKTIRRHAMTEHVPYEISFSASGFSGQKHVRYMDPNAAGAGQVSVTPSPSPTASAADASPSPSPDANNGSDSDGDAISGVVAEYQFPEDISCELLFWGGGKWLQPGEDGKVTSWIFQPSGLCNPLKVQFHRGTSWIQIAFNPLTGDIQEERYMIPE